jgi:rRNA maturation protein Nop10
MKTCDSCGNRIYREEPANAEYGVAVVDGKPYPDACPECGNSL